jgi:endonuclease YncB( thermonuclease family)
MKYFLLVLTLVSVCFAKDKLYGTITVKNVVSVYDGDTFTANLQDYYPAVIRDSISIRVYGVDTPEMKDPKPEVKEQAKKAKELATSILKSGKPIKLKNVRRDKYFRLLSEVWVGNVLLADTLVKAGLAKPYFGETKEQW